MTPAISRSATSKALSEAIAILRSGRTGEALRLLCRLETALNTPDPFMVAASERLAERAE